MSINTRVYSWFIYRLVSTELGIKRRNKPLMFVYTKMKPEFPVIDTCINK